MSSETTFHISRHLRSCNNIIDDKKLSIFKKFSEPALSLWGTITGLGLERGIQGNFKDIVYVSCLVRTWMTAIVQYLPYCSNNKLVLVVSPYIKEKHVKMMKAADIGNMPVAFPDQVNKIVRFYDFLTLIQVYLSKNYGQFGNSSIIATIKQRIDKILAEGTEIEIRFPKLNSTPERTFLLRCIRGKLSLITPIDSGFNPYSSLISRVSNFSLMKGGENSINLGEKESNYMKQNINAYIKQKQAKTKINDVGGIIYIPLKIKKIVTTQKGLFFKSQPQINPYTDYFEKEGMVLFMDWVKNSVKDANSDIYVIAHSNIMQATLVNICQLAKNNPLIDKKTLELCNPAFSTIKHQNIWEMVLNTSSLPDGSMSLDSMTVREGEDPPNIESTNAIDLDQEMSCFNKEIVMNNQPMPTKPKLPVMVPVKNAFSSAKSLFSSVFGKKSTGPPAIMNYKNAATTNGGKKKQTRRKVNRRKNTRKRRS